ncbi:MAG: DUF177 domain-containing protein [Saprospiraceae bacterium]|nr:MAG: putative metal-binding protein [Candidatus Parvibacillus calidus]MCC7150132.1 DUF177 domain-containing protein [Saprospiraceae bacterium]WKZ63093.1 MAG: YceD family protein [Saprospiraceae bacterium]
MAGLDQFIIPVKGLHLGMHNYRFEVDDGFFKEKQSTVVESGKFEVNVELDKHIDLMVLNISFSGKWRTSCDRCTADIAIPVDGQSEYLIKYATEESDDGDVIYIMRESSEINVSDLILDTITVGMPLSRTYDCESERPKPCDDEVLGKLRHNASEDNISSPGNPWSDLLGLLSKEE